MAHSQNFLNAVKALEALTVVELNELVDHWKLIQKHKRSIAGALESAEYKYGDIIRWSSKKRGRPLHQFMKFEKMNRARTCVVGMECDEKGNILKPAPGKTGQWTVAVTFVDMVNGKPV